MNVPRVAACWVGPALVILAGCGHGGGAATGEPSAPVRVDVPPPAATAASPELGEAIERAVPPAPSSRIALSLRLARAELLRALDRALPRELSQDYERITSGEQSPRVEVRYHAARDAPALTVEGGRLHLRVPVRYWADLRGAVRNPLPVGPRGWLSLGAASWGTRAKPQTLTLHASVGVSVDDDYRISPRPKLEPFVHGAPPGGKLCVSAGIRFCTPKEQFTAPVRASVERLLQPRLQAALTSLSSALRERLGALDVPGAWAALGCPLRLRDGRPLCGAGDAAPVAADDAYLRVVPERVTLAGPTLDGDDLVVAVAVWGRAVAELGGPPAAGAVALPKPAVGEVPDGLALSVQLRLPYAVAAAELQRQLSARAFELGAAGALTVRGVEIGARVDPAGQERLLIRLTLDGAARGVIYVWGSPDYDAETRTLRLAAVDYTLETADAFVAALESVNHAALREELRTRSSFAVGPQLDRLHGELQARLAGMALPGVEVRAVLERPRFGALSLTGEVAVAELSLRGDVSLRLRPGG